MTNQYDVVVLGGGPGGYVAAIRAAQLGLKTAVIEKEALGGVCLNIGCIPSKALLKNAEVAHLLQKRGREFGFKFENLQLDYAAAFKRSRQISSRLVKGVGFLMKKNGIDVYEGTGQLTGKESLKVALNDGGETDLTARHIIIATGARPRSLPGLDIDGERIITYKEAILSDKTPGRALIIGGGPIGVEFAYVWSNYGVEVTIVEMLNHLIPNEEPEISAVIEKAYKKLGVKLQLGTVVEKTEQTDDGIQVTLKNGEAFTVNQIMVAVSFVPNVENIGLEAAGVALTERGAIAIDDSMRTNVPNIYAIGDVTAKLMLAHVGSAMGLVAAETIAGHSTVTLDYRMMPRATYCVP
ncbi:MAG: dihydrolipoyl dehydrogenase, partial [Anaerolineae bacterium]